MTPQEQTQNMSNTNVDQNPITSLHPDIINTQILTKLNGPTLTSFSCTSTHLHSLTSDHHLWRNIAISTWPSITHPKLQSLISTFPHQYQSLYSHSFPLISPKQLTIKNRTSIDHVLNLVSGVDLFYKRKPILTRVVETECDSGWFHNSPFRIDMLESKESVTVPIASTGRDSDEDLRADLEENLTLSWILVNPVLKKSANLSSFRQVDVRQRWSTGDVQVSYATVLRMSDDDEIHCKITVVISEGLSDVDVREVSMCLEDMDGRNVCGEKALEVGERRKVRKGEAKERYESYLNRRRERRKVKDSRERLLDLVFIGVSVTVFVSFWGFVVLW